MPESLNIDAVLRSIESKIKKLDEDVALSDDMLQQHPATEQPRAAPMGKTAPTDIH